MSGPDEEKEEKDASGGWEEEYEYVGVSTDFTGESSSDDEDDED
ncbi:MAG: hypothetical protein QXO69_01370 [archaeon]